ncbi:hypothetical protein METP3_03342 [Methanosarcinales archaeon]|nr:hypothetical protein METP3_03342 [Methanosarcinales archaeon]
MNMDKLIKTEVIFIDNAPIKKKSDIHHGGHVRRYYAWITLNKMVGKVIPFRKENGAINPLAVRCMFKKDSKIWVEYGCGGTAHLFALFASFIGSNRLVLNIHDFLVIQRRDLEKNPPFFRRFRLQVIETLLINRAYANILAWPRMLDYFTPKKNQKLLIMVPGVGEDELVALSPNNKKNGRKIALYFGSMIRKGMIQWIAELFSEINGWELHLVGVRGDAEIAENENVKYIGSLSHDKLFDIISNADLVLIPYPKNHYMDRLIPMKIAYTLISGKPVISTRLQGLYEYISMLGLEENMIYLDDWNRDSLMGALKKAENIEIDASKTIEKLRSLSWEPRFRKAIEIIFNEPDSPDNQIKRI